MWRTHECARVCVIHIYVTHSHIRDMTHSHIRTNRTWHDALMYPKLCIHIHRSGTQYGQVKRHFFYFFSYTQEWNSTLKSQTSISTCKSQLDKSNVIFFLYLFSIFFSNTQQWKSMLTIQTSISTCKSQLDKSNVIFLIFIFFDFFFTYTGVEVNVDKSNVNFDVQVSVPLTSHNTHLSHPSPCAASATTGGRDGEDFLKSQRHSYCL